MVGLTVPAPTKEATLATSGSCRTISASALPLDHASKEIDGAASVMPRIKPGVLLREQALGDDEVEPTVATSVTSATASTNA